MSTHPFSERQGWRVQGSLIYDEAPDSLRYGVREVLHVLGYRTPAAQRDLLGKALRIPPDPMNWSESNIEWEVRDLVNTEPWYRLFDALERMPRFLSTEGTEQYYDEMNALFTDERMGYRFEGGRIERVGSSEFHAAVAEARSALEGERFVEPRRQFDRAYNFRNQHPPDWANAIKEAVNSIEAVLQVVYRSPGVALPSIVSENVDPILPSGIKQLFRSLYSQGSGTVGARHAAIGGVEPTGPRADLAIHVAAALHTFVAAELDNN